MNSKGTDIQKWRKCLGMCLICGQPFGIKSKYIFLKNEKEESTGEKKTDIESEFVEDDLDNITLEDFGISKKKVENVEDAIEKLLLREECPIRMVFMQFNMLAEQQDCHIIDQYTFLEKKNKEESFVHGMNANRAEMFKIDKLRLFQSFFEDVLKEEYELSQGKKIVVQSSILDQAIATCKRIGDKYIFAGCKRCNLCMNKPNFHVDSVWRCFSLTEKADYPELESRNVKAIKLKKLVQQVAFFFDYEKNETIIWRAKREKDIVLEINMYRCVSNLCYWGYSYKFRFRLIAIFHASFILFQRSTIQNSISFEDWHIHFFRELYMKLYKPDTFFGVKYIQIALIFDLSLKKGSDWTLFIQSKLIEFEKKLEKTYPMKDANRIYYLNEKIQSEVHDEKSLVAFLCGKDSIEEGTERLLDYFKYNVCQSPSNAKLKEACEKFQSKLCSAFRRLKNEK
jgi:hypothetical protein